MFSGSVPLEMLQSSSHQNCWKVKPFLPTYLLSDLTFDDSLFVSTCSIEQIHASQVTAFLKPNTQNFCWTTLFTYSKPSWCHFVCIFFQKKLHCPVVTVLKDWLFGVILHISFALFSFCTNDTITVPNVKIPICLLLLCTTIVFFKLINTLEKDSHCTNNKILLSAKFNKSTREIPSYFFFKHN